MHGLAVHSCPLDQADQCYLPKPYPTNEFATEFLCAENPPKKSWVDKSASRIRHQVLYSKKYGYSKNFLAYLEKIAFVLTFEQL